MPPNLSVVVGDARDGVRDKHLLYVQSRQVVAASSDGRLLRAVLRAGATLVDRPPPGGLTIHAIPLVDPDGSMTLVDPQLNHALRTEQSRLERRGYRVIDCTRVVVDPDTAHATLSDAAACWEVDRGRFDAEFPPGPGDDDLRSVDAPVTRVIVPTRAVPGSAAESIAAAAGLVRDETGRLCRADVERLARMLTRAVVTPSLLTDPRPLADLVATG